MHYSEITTPVGLMQFLDTEFSYGVIDKQGNRLIDSNTSAFQNACYRDWTLRPISQMLKERIGHCYDQVEIERDWFESHGYEVKTFWICAFEPGKAGYSHAYLLYKDKNKWCLFEHANIFCKGIYSFNSLNDAIKFQANQQIEYANSQKEASCYELCIKEFIKPSIGLTMQEYMAFIDAGKEYALNL